MSSTAHLQRRNLFNELLVFATIKVPLADLHAIASDLKIKAERLAASAGANSRALAESTWRSRIQRVVAHTPRTHGKSKSCDARRALPSLTFLRFASSWARNEQNKSNRRRPVNSPPSQLARTHTAPRSCEFSWIAATHTAENYATRNQHSAVHSTRMCSELLRDVSSVGPHMCVGVLAACTMSLRFAGLDREALRLRQARRSPKTDFDARILCVSL